MREAGRADFDLADATLLDGLASHLTEGLRRAILLSALSGNEEERGVGLLLLTEEDTVALANAAAELWLGELRGSDGGDRLPFVVHAVADRARNVAAGRMSGAASARVRAPSGRWLLVRGSMLGDGADARTVVLLEAAQAPELAPLIADGYGLTQRERTVTQLVAQGASTDEIAGRLYLSPYTVQDHLKAVFDKVGVSTRGELVARLFFDHYAPRLASGATVGSDGWFAPGRESTPN
jgi:DNA-binding CsgD family transcriptional regulator